METKRKLLLGLLVFGLCAVSWSVGRLSAPTKTKVVEKIVTKVVVKTKVAIDRKTKTTKTTKPDGTSTEVTEVEDKSKIDQNSQTDQQTDRLKTAERKSSEWMLGGYYGRSALGKVTWGAQAQRRLLGGLWGGVYGFGDKSFGVGLSFQF